MIRHIGQWLAGDEEEDHLAAIAFGVMCLMTYEEEWKTLEAEGLTSDKDGYDTNPLDDRYKRLSEILPSLLTSVSPPAKLETEGKTVACSNCGSLRIQDFGTCFDCKNNE